MNKIIALYKELGNGYTYLGFNLKHKPFDDVRVRQAINYAIDKQELIDGVLLGWASRSLHPINQVRAGLTHNSNPIHMIPQKQNNCSRKQVSKTTTVMASWIAMANRWRLKSLPTRTSSVK